jgi:dTDP-4-dehydrorhamnose 3,5-epimerase-like enzyme
MLGKWKTFRDPDGILAPIEFNSLPFEPRRIFYVSGVPKGEERGMHAHYNTQQIITCLQGEILVKLHNGFVLQEYTLRPDEWIFIDRLMWDSQVFLTGQDILMSMCSTVYDRLDYIEDFDTFIKITKDDK